MELRGPRKFIAREACKVTSRLYSTPFFGVQRRSCQSRACNARFGFVWFAINGMWRRSDDRPRRAERRVQRGLHPRSSHPYHRSVLRTTRIAHCNACPRRPRKGFGLETVTAHTSALGEPAVRALRLWPIEHAGAGVRATPSDVKLQHELRTCTVAWLQKAENAEHRYMGWSIAPLEPDEADPSKFKTPPPPSSAEMSVHLKSGTYAAVPCWRALAEVLECTIISLDSSASSTACRCSRPERRRLASCDPGAPSSRRCSAATPAPMLRGVASAGGGGDDEQQQPQPRQRQQQQGQQQRPRRVLVLINNGARETEDRTHHECPNSHHIPAAHSLTRCVCHVAGSQRPGGHFDATRARR